MDRCLQRLAEALQAAVYPECRENMQIINKRASGIPYAYIVGHKEFMKLDFEVNKKELKKYIGLRKLEITCGEAPYIVSRYDS